MFFGDIFIASIAVLGNIFLGLFTYFKNIKSATNKLFFIFATSLAIYIIINFEALHQTTPLSTLFWVRMIMSIAGILVFLFYLLVETFPSTKLQTRVFMLFFGTLSSCLVIIVAQMNLIFTGIVFYGHNTVSIPGPGLPLFLFHTAIFLGGGFLLLIRKYMRSTGLKKQQIKLFLYGTIIMFLFILITNLTLVIVLKTVMFVGLLPIYTLVFIGCISYAIVRHRFLDIQLILARSVAYVLILIILGTFYTFYLFFVGTALFHLEFTISQFILYGLIMLFVAFTFQPLRSYLESITDAILYKGHYDSQKLLKRLSDVMAQTIILETLTSSILNIILQEMRITRGIFILLKKSDHRFIDFVESNGFDSLPFFIPDEIYRFIDRPPLVFDELEEGLLKDLLRTRNLTIVLPLKIQDEKIGLLCFGEKSSGDIYQKQDINILSILAPQLSVAIQNAKEYDEIKRFNTTLRDEVERATKELQKANDKLKDLDKLKDEFVSLASHELRTPMTAIKSYLWLVLRQSADMGTLTEKQKLYVERTYTSTERLIKLVNDMLNVSRIESGRLSINMKPLNILNLVKDVCTDVTPSAQNAKLTIKILEPDLPIPLVLADSDKIKQVIINLIGNSIKFTPPGGIITISFTKKENSVFLHISDTGKGIKKEDIVKLFQKFGLIESSYTVNPNAVGTGLGLYISKSIIEKQGGSIWVKSEGENKGSTFSFSLKLADNNSTMIQQEQN